MLLPAVAQTGRRKTDRRNYSYFGEHSELSSPSHYSYSEANLTLLARFTIAACSGRTQKQSTAENEGSSARVERQLSLDDFVWLCCVLVYIIDESAQDSQAEPERCAESLTLVHIETCRGC